MKRFKFFVVLLLVLCLTFAFAEKKANRGKLISSSPNETVIKFQLDSYDVKRVKTQQGTAVELSAPSAARLLEKGNPDLLKFSEAVIVPDRGKMKIQVIDSTYTELDHVNLVPSKGNLLRTVNPKKIPYTYGNVYQKDVYFPGKLADVGQPYIARDFRGQAVLIYPFQYNPVTARLRVYSSITIKVSKEGDKGGNEFARNEPLDYTKLNDEFKSVYSRHFLNFNALEKSNSSLQYTPVLPNIGNMLIVSYGDFMDEMANFVTWKQSYGYNVSLVDYATIGSAAALKTYVANYYTTNGLVFLLLVGDNAQIPVSSTTAGDSDANYAYIVGSDHYADIFIGRFSAETAAHVTTQVDRTIYYERDLASSATWFRRAVGMASAEGPGHLGEYDATHMDQIMTDLTNYGYTISKNYQTGGTAANLSTLVNNGTGAMFYCGHGNYDGWYCGWSFLNAQVAALTNDNMLPAIYSVACQVGNFKSYTCFCEYWLRELNGTNPAGAVAHAGSTINQSWNPPMDAQDEMADILISSSGPKRTFGGVFINGVFKMIDINGTAGSDMADTWVCFGDASVQLRTPGTPNGPSSTPLPPVANFTGSPTTVSIGGTVNFTDASSGSPTSWAWSFEGGTPTSSSSQNPSVVYNTVGTYNVSLTATNAQGSDGETKTDYITVVDQPTGYCAATGTTFSYEWIAGVVVGAMNKTSGAAGYSDFTATTVNLSRGVSTNVSLTPGFSSSTYTEYWKIWIDYNRDGDFADTGEEVFSGSGTSVVSGSFIVSSGATLGTTRMRVIMKYGGQPTSCETFSYGEVEDYTANIVDGGPQPPVANFTASATSITVGQSVTFTDQSTNTPTAWAWTLEGGTPASSSTKNPVITYNTAGSYDVSLTATNSAGSDGETKLDYILVNPTGLTYCTSSGNSQADEWISRVRVANIDKSSTASPYSDFTATVGTLTRGTSASVTLNTGYSGTIYTEYWRIWIDYNHDGDFADTGEQVFSKSGTTSVTGTFTTSSSALTGTTRMRVTMRYGSYPTYCGTFTYGEVEDYTVNIL